MSSFLACNLRLRSTICLSRVKNYHQLAVACRASFWTAWNVTSRTTAQDALWQHILNRNTSSQPFMTPYTRQVMNRISGDLTPSSARCWGRPTHAQWAHEHSNQSNILTYTGETDSQQDQLQPQTETPTTPRQGNSWSRVTFARNMESSPQWWFLRFPVARRGRCHSGICSGLAKHKSRVLSPPLSVLKFSSFFTWLYLSWIVSHGRLLPGQPSTSKRDFITNYTPRHTVGSPNRNASLTEQPLP